MCLYCTLVEKLNTRDINNRITVSSGVCVYMWPYL